MAYTENIIEIELENGNTLLYYAHPSSGKFMQESVGVDGETLTHRGNLLIARCNENDISFMLKVLCDVDYTPDFVHRVLSGQYSDMHFTAVPTDEQGYVARATEHQARRRR